MSYKVIKSTQKRNQNFKGEMEKNMNRKEYTNYGTFNVTTEGDCEGRSIKNLGTYTGYIDEIAFALADKCCYTLCFKLVEPESFDLTPKKDTVNISLDIDSGAWDLNIEDATEYLKNFFANRDVEVVDVRGYGSCTISTRKETIEEKKKKILQKLSDEEKQILGLV